VTIIRFKYAKPTAAGANVAAPATITAVPTAPRTVEGAPDTIVIPAPFTIDTTTGGTADINLAPTGAGWCWKITTTVTGVYAATHYVLVPDAAAVDYADLVHVDPDTLEPGATPDAAWWAEIEALKVLGGVPGTPGTNGTNGVDGKDGRDGAQGMPGEKGEQGEPGPKGDTGAPGAKGNTGSSGVNGVEGARGPEGPAASVLVPWSSGGDDTSMLNAFIAANAGKIIVFRTTTYRVTNTISVPTETTLDLNGAFIDATAMPYAVSFRERPVFLAAGTVEASLAITTPVAQWSYNIDNISSTAGFSAGNLVVVYNQEQPVPGLTRGDRDKGELRIVKSVDSPSSLTFATGALQGYGTTGLGIQRVNPVTNVVIKNGKITMGGTGSRHNAIRVEYGRNPLVENMIIDGAAQSGIEYMSVFNGRIRGNTVVNSDDEFVGYGIVLMDGTVNVTVERNYLRNCKHLIAGGGKWPTTHISVINNHGIGLPGYAAFDCHESTYYWRFAGNVLKDVGNGFLIRGQYITVENNEVTNASQQAYKADTWDHVSEQRNIRFINNTANRATLGGIWLDGIDSGDGAKVYTDPGYTTDPDVGYRDVNAPCLKIDCEITGNTLNDAGANPILARHYNGVTINGNNINGGTGNAVLLTGLAVAQSNRATLNGNRIRDNAGDAIKIERADGTSISGGSITAPTSHGIEGTNSSRITINGLTIRTPGLAGVQITGGTVHTVGNCHISGGTSASYDALRFSGCADVTVSGGYYASNRYAVYSSTTDNVVVAGIHAKAATNVARISVDATNKIVANNLI